ncbi:VWA domain-containing protein [Blastopirellula sp. JC732]|uniref:VWA domain-containing protein n=1 Tax=Blastopirellula sediminis TaxID=2894196 RepID=A0A9X1SF01_9BACT|nr:vWA domain-containing protein [Blastopirellula sediminis]MCC9608091.1 VWA domain-containing protein [Blastopirellula sediminis]MCC9627116.1 VWA domain-containing protein [Blastopirellula sediminis]
MSSPWREHESSEYGALGWISNLDALMIGSILTFFVAIAALYAYAQADSELRKKNLKEEAGVAEVNDLERKIADLISQIQLLRAELEKRNATIAALESHQRALEAAENEWKLAYAAAKADVETLRKELDELIKRIAALEQSLKLKGEELAKVKTEFEQLKDLSKTKSELLAQIKQIDAELQAMKREFEIILAEANELKKKNASLEAQNLKMQQELAAILKKMQEMQEELDRLKTEAKRFRVEEFIVRRQLLGIPSDLQSVAILVDRSLSMKAQDDGKNMEAAQGGWEVAKETVRTWLAGLDMERSVLITFGTDVKVFPEGAGLLETGQDDVGRKNRDALLAQLDSLKPGGYTNTLGALEKAYERGVSTIILFTDGEPTVSSDGNHGSPEELTQKILTLAKEKKIPIVTVALGDYGYPVYRPQVRDETLAAAVKRGEVRPRLMEFLTSLSHDTGGTFIGKAAYAAANHAE